jgi:hypothetical protein
MTAIMLEGKQTLASNYSRRSYRVKMLLPRKIEIHALEAFESVGMQRAHGPRRARRRRDTNCRSVSRWVKTCISFGCCCAIAVDLELTRVAKLSG